MLDVERVLVSSPLSAFKIRKLLSVSVARKRLLVRGPFTSIVEYRPADPGVMPLEKIKERVVGFTETTFPSASGKNTGSFVYNELEVRALAVTGAP